MFADPIKIKKDDIHKKVDDSVINIVKHMGNIFEKIKFNQEQLVEDTNNLEIISSTETIANKLQELSNIVCEMKVDYLKKTEFENLAKKQKQKDIMGLSNFINVRLNQLIENHNFLNTLIRDNKMHKYYKYSLNFPLD